MVIEAGTMIIGVTSLIISLACMILLTGCNKPQYSMVNTKNLPGKYATKYGTRYYKKNNYGQYQMKKLKNNIIYYRDNTYHKETLKSFNININPGTHVQFAPGKVYFDE